MIIGIFSLSVSLTASAAIQPEKMSVLPLGQVKADGFLRRQLINQRDGLTGHAERIYRDIGESDWLTGKKVGGEFGWERGPYYARGLLALAYILDDAELKAKAKRWVEAYFASQRADGDIGPRNGNWWANMLVLHFMRDWYEVTGDERVIPFLERYFRFQKAALVKIPLGKESRWAASRGGDELGVALWLYEKTKNAEWLEFAEFVRGQTCDWAEWYADPKKTDVYSSGGSWPSYQLHIVNINQGLKSAAYFWRLTGSQLHRNGWKNATDPKGWLMSQCGRVDGTFNGTEPISNHESTQGIELCAQAERILSEQILMSVFGDAEIGDDMETVAYNLLPSTMHPEIRGTRYYHILNQPMCVDDGRINKGKERGYNFNDNGAAEAMAPGPEAGFGCCRSNFHMAWPKFVQSMWMGRGDGLAAVAYGPCRVEANGFTLVEKTSYPFADRVDIVVKAAPSNSSTLSFRVPKWTEGADIQVNGVSINGTIPGCFTDISRVWKKGDRVTLTFPAKTSVIYGGKPNYAAIRHGVLLYAWPVPSEWKYKGDKKFPKCEIYPTAPWNVALLLDGKNDLEATPVVNGSLAENPFNPSTPPLKLKVRAFRTSEAGWGTLAEGSVVKAKEPPMSPFATSTDAFDLELVPLCSTQTRITLFPWAKNK